MQNKSLTHISKALSKVETGAWIQINLGSDYLITSIQLTVRGSWLFRWTNAECRVGQTGTEDPGYDFQWVNNHDPQNIKCQIVHKEFFRCHHGQVRTARRSAGGYITRYDIYTPWLLSPWPPYARPSDLTDHLVSLIDLWTPPHEMFDLEGKWPNKVQPQGSTLGPCEIRTAITPPVHDIIHRHRASFYPLIHSQWQLHE